MRRIYNLSLLCIAAGASACSMPDVVIPTEVLPYAGVRFINAVPDSSGAFGMDFRFVDLPESNAHFKVAFRNLPSGSIGSQIQYKGAREGNRHFRIFLDDTIAAITSTVVKDSTVALVKGRNYTAMMWGNGRSTGTDRMRLSFWEEDVTAPAGAAKIKIRVINATNAAIDVRAYRAAAAAAQTGAPTWAAVAPYTASTYVEVDSGSYFYNVRAAGAATNLVVTDIQSVLGIAASCSGLACKPGEKIDLEASPGTRIAGSAVTGIVFPRSTAGSRAPQATAFQSPTVLYMWDRRPARTCDPYC